jgi:gas vesicle protein
MKNKNNTNTNNGIGSGFLLGFLIGVLATLLLTTKKGREILKELIDKGMQKITDLEEAHEKTKQKQEPESENDYVKPKPEEVKKEIKYLAQEKKVNEKGGSSSHAAVRRLFFRKSPKKTL